VNVARLFNIAGSEVIRLEDGTPAVRTVLNWVVAAPFVGTALQENFVTFTATVRDANGNQGVATKTFQLTHSAANGDKLTPQPTSSNTGLSISNFSDGDRPNGQFGR
jgi:fibronectin type 3 domain-containing protein